MKRLLKLVRTFPRGVEGQDLTEYALLIALIALAAVGAVGIASGQINALFNAINIPIPAA
jgi:Flp pilus assembly pilin Flp